MNTDDRLIKKTFLGIWAVNGASTLFGIACVMIDAIMTGQFLGSDSVAASGLVQPVVMILTLVGALFGPGLVIVCTRYMGMAVASVFFGIVMSKAGFDAALDAQGIDQAESVLSAIKLLFAGIPAIIFWVICIIVIFLFDIDKKDKIIN